MMQKRPMDLMRLPDPGWTRTPMALCGGNSCPGHPLYFMIASRMEGWKLWSNQVGVSTLVAVAEFSVVRHSTMQADFYFC
jgi:hypothetical protein